MSERKPFYPVVVIYNEKCCCSPSCRALLNLGYDVLVVDNSTSDMGNEQYCAEHGMEYICMHGNAGLSKAYNAALDRILKSRDGGFVIWLDDDTELDENYFEKLSAATDEDRDSLVFVPVVRSALQKDCIISPSVINDNLYYNLKQPDSVREIKEKGACSAINSGMAVNLKVYDDYRYDESMFLDFVDHDFMHSMNARHIGIHVMYDAELFQNYSVHENTPLKNKLARDDIFRRDYRIYCKKAGIPGAVAEKRLIEKRLKLYRDILKK